MASIHYIPSVGHPGTSAFGWVVPGAIVLLAAIGAVSSLIAGLPSPVVIGADGLAGTWLGAP